MVDLTENDDDCDDLVGKTSKAVEKAIRMQKRVLDRVDVAHGFLKKLKVTDPHKAELLSRKLKSISPVRVWCQNNNCQFKQK